MFEALIESKRTLDKKRSLGMGFVSLTIHTALIAAAIVATVKAGQSDTKVRADTTMVIVLPDREKKPQVQIDELIRDIRKGEVRIDIPPGPPIGEGGIVVDPSVVADSGVESGVAKSVAPTEDWYPESLVEEKPSVLSAPQPYYPELLHQAGIGGRVLIQAIIDTSGRADPSSVRIIQSPNPAFDSGSRNWILHALFRPARVHGRAVRVLIQVPLDYRITSR